MMSELGINELEADRGTRKKICITVGGVYVYQCTFSTLACTLTEGKEEEDGVGGGTRRSSWKFHYLTI